MSEPATFVYLADQGPVIVQSLWGEGVTDTTTITVRGITERTNHRFIIGPTHDECGAEGEDGHCLRPYVDRIHFPPGDDWDEVYAKLSKWVKEARQHWDSEEIDQYGKVRL